MSDQWHYRIYGQQFGPVSLDLVRTLVAAGTIAPDDEVREVGRSNWILACAATELRDSIDAQKISPNVDRRTGRDEWYCRGNGGDYGPMTISELIQLAAEGELRPDEEIKANADDYWKKVCSIQRLVELLPFADRPQARPRKPVAPVHHQPETSDEALILPFPSRGRNEQFNALRETVQTSELDPAVTSESSPTLDACDAATQSYTLPLHAGLVRKSPSETIEDNTAEQWTGWIAGEEFGPINYSELLMWAVTGRLSPTDFVRRGHEGQYVPAVNIPCLFTVQAAANSLSRRACPATIKIAEEPVEAPDHHAEDSAGNSSVSKSTALSNVPSRNLKPTAAVSQEANLLQVINSLQNSVWQVARRILHRDRV